MTIIITYETLFDILRRESSREDLQSLPNTFITDIQTFLVDKKDAASGIDAASQRASIEYENIKKILRELYERRERKILLMALNKARTESAIIDQSAFLEEEKDLFETIVKILQDKKTAFLTHMDIASTGFVRSTPMTSRPLPPTPAAATPSSATPPPPTPEFAKPKQKKPGEVHIVEPEPDTSGVRVKFLKAVPKFVGRDMTIFGPFDVESVTSLPEDVASVLEKKGHLELVTVEQ